MKQQKELRFVLAGHDKNCQTFEMISIAVTCQQLTSVFRLEYSLRHVSADLAFFTQYTIYGEEMGIFSM